MKSGKRIVCVMCDFVIFKHMYSGVRRDSAVYAEWTYLFCC